MEPLENMPDGSKTKNDKLDEQREDAFMEATNRLNKAVNELFAADMAGAFFGKVNPFSPINGQFYCEQVLQAVGQFISQQFEVEVEKMNDRVSKYTNRAQRRAKK